MVPVLGKGLGIVAKRTMPAGYRIIVEPIFTDPAGHPGIQDLMPEGGTLSEKFEFNGSMHRAVEGEDGMPLGIGFTQYVSLRICRVNVKCVPNAETFFCDTKKVRVLVANQQILAGQEIGIPTFCPINLGRVVNSFDALIYRSVTRAILLSKWNIICIPDCACKDPYVDVTIMLAYSLGREVKEMLSKDSPPTLKPADLLVLLNSTLVLGLYNMTRAKAHHDAATLTFLCLAARKHEMSRHELIEKMDRAIEWLTIARDVAVAASPHSACAIKFQNTLNGIVAQRTTF